MARKKNRIEDAFEKLDEEDIEDLESEEPSEDAQDEALDEDADEFLENSDAGDLTDEEVVAEVARMDTARRQLIESSRRRGQQPKDAKRRLSAVRAERKAREQEHLDMDWRPASSTMAPPAQPGMEQRWIRFQVGERSDPRNWTRKTKERWVPRRLSTVAESYMAPTVKHGQLGDVIGVEDLILCERPIEVGASRRRYYDAVSRRQRAAAERQSLDSLQDKYGHEIISKERREVTAGRGRRRPNVQD